MKSVRKQTNRSAFTLIELIFAIVIISIGVLALPTVLFTNAASQEQTLKEEGIMLTTTKIAQILTYPWDQNSSPLSIMSTSQVLTTIANPPDGLERNGISDFRIGHFPGELRRRMTPYSNERNATSIGGANNIGSFNNEEVTIGAAGSDQGYKKEYNITTSVIYVDDNATYSATNVVYNFGTVAVPGATSNIKMVQVSTAEKDAAGAWQPIIVMRSYSANIGEAEFYKRRY